MKVIKISKEVWHTKVLPKDTYKEVSDYFSPKPVIFMVSAIIIAVTAFKYF